MLPFSDRFPDRLQDALKLLHGTDNPTFDKLQLRYNSGLELLQRDFIVIDMTDGVRRVWMFTGEVVLARMWVEDGGEVMGEACPVSK